jgi:hypothetical protein
VCRWELGASNVHRNQPFHEFPASVDVPIKTADPCLAGIIDGSGAQNQIPNISRFSQGQTSDNANHLLSAIPRAGRGLGLLG